MSGDPAFVPFEFPTAPAVCGGGIPNIPFPWSTWHFVPQQTFTFIPTAPRLSDEDVERIARRVVELQRAAQDDAIRQAYANLRDGVK